MLYVVFLSVLIFGLLVYISKLLHKTPLNKWSFEEIFKPFIIYLYIGMMTLAFNLQPVLQVYQLQHINNQYYYEKNGILVHLGTPSEITRSGDTDKYLVEYNQNTLALFPMNFMKNNYREKVILKELKPNE